MKKIFLAFCFLCFAHGFSQIAGTDKEIIKNVCRKWKLSHDSVNGEIIPVKMPGEGIFIIFSADYTYTPGETKEAEGNWSFDAEGRTIAMTMNGTENGYVISIKGDEMVIVDSLADATDPQAVKSHYIAVK